MSLQLPFERDESGVVTLTLRQPDRPVVVLDWELLRAIDAALDEIGTDLAGFVLASDSRVFVAGANLQEIMELSDAELEEYLRFGSRVYGRIATLPCTTVAAINGAALGGGLEIAMHCDHLVAQAPGEKPYLIGLPEAGLGICPGWGGTNLLPARMDMARAIRATAEGKPMPVSRASEEGLVEEMAPDREGLMEASRRLARRPKAMPRAEPVSIAEDSRRKEAADVVKEIRDDLPGTQAALAVLHAIDRGLEDGWEAALEAERSALIRLRNTEEGRSAIEQFFARSGARSK